MAVLHNGTLKHELFFTVYPHSKFEVVIFWLIDLVIFVWLFHLVIFQFSV